MDFYAKYRQFLREYVDKKYLQQYNNLTVLAENFLDKYYVVLFETQEDSLYHPMPETRRFILVENIEKPIISELKALPYTDGYIRVRKSELSKIVGEKLYRKFVNRGIATTQEIGERRNKPFCWHRLVACLYYNCLCKEVHHINKNTADNNINNLLPIEKGCHSAIDKDIANGKNLSLMFQEQLKNKYHNKRNTVASNSELVEEIAEMLWLGYKVNKIVKLLNHRIEKTSVYKIRGNFYYFKEFLFWLNHQEQQAWERLDGKSLKRWEKVIEFENPKHRVTQIVKCINERETV